MHRNCHLGRAFSLLPRRRLGRMNAADPLTESLVDSQTSDMDSIPIARSISPVDAVGFTGFPLRNYPLPPSVLKNGNTGLPSFCARSNSARV